MKWSVEITPLTLHDHAATITIQLTIVRTGGMKVQNADNVHDTTP